MFSPMNFYEIATNLLFGYNIAILTVATVFFSLFDLKSKQKEDLKFIRDNDRGTLSKSQIDEKELILNKQIKETDKKIQKIGSSFKFCILFSLANSVLIMIYASLQPQQFIDVIGKYIFISFSLIATICFAYNIFLFGELFKFDLINYSEKINKKLRDRDLNKQDILELLKSARRALELNKIDKARKIFKKVRYVYKNSKKIKP